MKILQNRRLKNKIALSFSLFGLFLWCQNISLFAQDIKNSRASVKSVEDFNFPFGICWTYFTKADISNVFASDNRDGLLVTTHNSELISLNLSGETEWKTELGGQAASNLLIIGDEIFLVSKPVNDNASKNAEMVGKMNTLRSVNRSTGVTNRLIKTFNSEKVFLFGFQDNVIVIGQEGIIKCIRAADGGIVWEQTLDTELSAQPFVESGQVLILGTADGYILRRSLITGEEISKHKVSTPPTTVLLNSSGRNLFWGDAKGSVFSVKNLIPTKPSKNRNYDWRFRNGARISHLTLTVAGLLVSSDDNFVYLISSEEGEIIWKKRFTGRIASEPFVVGGYALVITTAESYASIIEVSSGKTVNKISLKDNNGFTNSPVETGNQIVFPTLDGVLSFSPNCSAD